MDGVWKLSRKPKMSLDIDMERIIKQVFERQDIVLDEELWSKSFSKYSEAIGKGFGQIEYRDNRADILAKMKRNVATFSAFKNHNQINEMVDALTDPRNGKLRNWSAFKIAARKINAKYNQNWLHAEYDTAVQSSRMARKWSDYERDADAYPYLRYETQGDSRVRPEHQILDGVIKPINDPFWERYYPPNGWRCRCDVVQVRSDAGGKDFIEPDDKAVPQEFRRNTGKDGEVLNSVKFIEHLSNEKQLHIMDATRKASLLNEDSYINVEENIQAHYQAILEKEKSEKESLKFYRSLRAAQKIKHIDNFLNVKLLPEIDNNAKNPDLLINGDTYVECKELNKGSAKSFKNRFLDAYQQVFNGILNLENRAIFIDASSMKEREYLKSIRNLKERYRRDKLQCDTYVYRRGDVVVIKKAQD